MGTRTFDCSPYISHTCKTKGRSGWLLASFSRLPKLLLKQQWVSALSMLKMAALLAWLRPEHFRTPFTERLAQPSLGPTLVGLFSSFCLCRSQFKQLCLVPDLTDTLHSSRKCKQHTEPPLASFPWSQLEL